IAIAFCIAGAALAAKIDRSWGADRLNTAYISTTPGSSSVIWVAKETRIFDKYGIDATVIFISGSVRGIQSILAGEILIGEGGGPTAEFALKVGLKKIGIDPLKDVNLRVIGGAIERMVALQKGIVNFTVVTEAGKAMAEKLGYPTVVDMVALQIPFPQNGIYTSTRLIR